MTRETVETEEGYEIVLRCIADGIPHPNISWHKDGKELVDGVVLRDSNQVLFISHAKLNHSGKYLCRVSNYLQSSSAVATVFVSKRLSFAYKSHSSLQAFEGNDVNIACFFENGVQPIHVSWFKNGKKISLGSKSLKIKKGLLVVEKVEISDGGTYKCRVSSQVSAIESETRLSILPISCKGIWKMGGRVSGNYYIYPTKDHSKSARVYCDMNKNGLTIVSHDSERKIMVDGYEDRGSYDRKIIYDMPSNLLEALVEKASWCEQYIRYDCRNSILGMGSHSGNQYGWWVSAKGRKMQNWGGVDHTRKGCACGLRWSCAGGGVCNCDKNDNVWREDSGILNEKEYLPVSEVRFGDTGDSGEMGHHTVGKLACY